MNYSRQGQGQASSVSHRDSSQRGTVLDGQDVKHDEEARSTAETSPQAKSTPQRKRAVSEAPRADFVGSPSSALRAGQGTPPPDVHSETGWQAHIVAQTQWKNWRHCFNTRLPWHFHVGLNWIRPCSSDYKGE